MSAPTPHAPRLAPMVGNPDSIFIREGGKQQSARSWSSHKVFLPPYRSSIAFAIPKRTSSPKISRAKGLAAQLGLPACVGTELPGVGALEYRPRGYFLFEL